MSSGGVIEFLNELDETESIIALQNAFSQNSVLIFKLSEFSNPQHTKIDSFFEKKIFLGNEISALNFNLDQDVSIKFNIGTEIYFVKTKFKRHLNQIYFDRASQVVQLKRRKEPRYLIPKKWNQSSRITDSSKEKKVVVCQVQDISLSGIRFEVADSNLDYTRDEIIKIEFQIYKRAEISTEAIVRFLLKRPGQSTLLGMEFFKLKSLQKERIAHIVEDIINYQAVTKF